MQLDQMTGAGGTITLGGRELLISRPTFRDHGTITAWVKQNTPCPYAQAKEKLEKIQFMKEINPDLYKQKTEQYLIEAEDKSRKMEETLPLGEAIKEKGWTFPIWTLIRHNGADVTIENVESWISKESPENLLKIQEKVVGLLGGETSDDPTRPAAKTPGT